MRCMRWAGSIAGTCEVGLAQVIEDGCSRAVAQLQGRILGSVRSRADGVKNPNLDASGVGQGAFRGERDTRTSHCGGNYGTASAESRSKRACMKFQ